MQALPYSNIGFYQAYIQSATPCQGKFIIMYFVQPPQSRETYIYIYIYIYDKTI